MTEKNDNLREVAEVAAASFNKFRNKVAARSLTKISRKQSLEHAQRLAATDYDR